MTRSHAVIRRATPADAALLAALGERTFTDTFAATNTPEDLAAYLPTAFGEAIQRAELADSRNSVLLADVEAESVGYTIVSATVPDECVRGPKPMEIVRLYVRHEWHGRGVANSLMQAALDEARARGAETVWLGVWEQNGRGLAFYRRWGFVDVGTHPFTLGTDVQTDRVMARSLATGM